MAQLHTGWHANAKVLRLGLAAMGLHAWSISYCDHGLTDGFIPTGAWPALTGVSTAVKRLVDAGMWTAVTGGYLLHDYTNYNRTRAQVESYMAAKTEAGRAGGHAKASKTRSKRLADAKADALANSYQNSSSDSSKRPSKNLHPIPVNSPLPVSQLVGLSSPGARPREDEAPIEVLERLARRPIPDQLTNQPISNSYAER